MYAYLNQKFVAVMFPDFPGYSAVAGGLGDPVLTNNICFSSVLLFNKLFQNVVT